MKTYTLSTCRHAYTRKCVSIYIYIYTYIHTHRDSNTYTPMNTKNTRAPACINTYINTHKHSLSHTHTQP